MTLPLAHHRLLAALVTLLALVLPILAPAQVADTVTPEPGVTPAEPATLGDALALWRQGIDHPRLYEFYRKDLVRVKFRNLHCVRMRDGRLTDLNEHRALDESDTKRCLEALLDEGCEVFRTWRVPEETMDGWREGRVHAVTGAPLPDMNNSYLLRLSESCTAGEVARILNGLSTVDYADFVPLRASHSAPSGSGVPDFTDWSQPLPAGIVQWQQRYLGRASGGVDAKFAWQSHFGRGAGVKVVAIEQDPNYNHVELEGIEIINGGQVRFADSDHATAVCGIIGAANDGVGVTGIAHEASLAFSSYWFATDPNNFDPNDRDDFTLSPADAIAMAINATEFGDVFSFSFGAEGPYSNNDVDPGFGDLPLEWSKTNYDIISLAVATGRIVVIAAGNGSQNLDDPIYSQGMNGWPPGTGPFMPEHSSGSILVGAGAPPWLSGTLNRSPMSWTNYGSRVVLQGWGDLVVTAGSGDIVTDPTLDPCFELMTADPNLHYTWNFGGTSAAAPMVAACCAVLQSMLEHLNGTKSFPDEVLEILQDTGTPQVGTEQIGPLPNLKAAFESLVPPGPGVVTPTVMPPFGDYSTNYGLEISFDQVPDPGDRIYYTLDGSTPTEESRLWNGVPFWIRDTTSIAAIRVKIDGNSGIPTSSQVTRGIYQLTNKIPPPVFRNAKTGEPVESGATVSGSSASPFLLAIESPRKGTLEGQDDVVFWRVATSPDNTFSRYTGPIEFEGPAHSVVAFTGSRNPYWDASDTFRLFFSVSSFTTNSTGGALQLVEPIISPTDSEPLSPFDEVRMSTTALGPVIRFTLDGTEPNPSSPVFIEPFPLTKSTVVKARSFLNGYVASETVTRSYTFQGESPIPVFDPGPGSHDDSLMVSLQTPIPAATIRLTLDGTEPQKLSPVFSAPISLGVGRHVIKAISRVDGAAQSATASGVFEVYSTAPGVQTPVISPPSSLYNEPMSVEMFCPTEGATIHYTLNDFTDDPDQSDPVYTPGTPLVLTSADLNPGDTAVYIKTKAFKAGESPSATAQINYTIFPVSGTVQNAAVHPAGGVFHNEVSAVFSYDTDSVLTVYSLDGTIPSVSTPPTNPSTMTTGPDSENSPGGGTVSEPISLDATGELRFAGTRNARSPSPMRTAEFRFVCAPPAFDTETGTYHESVTFALGSATDGAAIHFTTDGTPPSSSSPTYAGPESLGEGQHVVQAIAVKPGYEGSAITTAHYKVTPPLSAPVVTVTPLSRRAPLEGNLRFEASASGFPEPSYTWKRDGVPLTESGPVLTLSRIGPADFGTYTVTASNSQGSDTSSPFTLSESEVQSVSNTEDSGPGSLRQAIADAAPGDIIDFSTLPDITGTVVALTGGALLIDKELTIDASARNFPLVLQGDADGIPGAGGFDQRILTITTGGDAIIRGLTFRNGKRAVVNSARVLFEDCIFTYNSTEDNPFSRTGPSDPHSDTDGGALYNQPTGVMVVNNSIIRHNEAGDNGGGIYNNRGRLTVTNTTFEDNEAGDSGGAMRSESGSHNELFGCEFNGNNVDSSGGAIFSIGTTVIGECSFSQNDANSDGGALLLTSSGSATVFKCSFNANTAGDDGGAIASYRPLTIIDSQLDQNTCNDDGAGIYNEDELTMSRCTGTGNLAGGSGGILRNSTSSGDATIDNCTFDTLTFISGGSVRMTNVTIASETGGNGIRLVTGDLHLKSCIVSPFNGTDFTTGISMDDSGDESISSSGVNLISVNTSVESEFSVGSFVGTAIDPIDPILAPLGDYGGPTVTRPPLPGSPAIDPYNGFIGSAIPTDQRGFDRHTGLFVDCGAVEYQPSLLVTNSLDNGQGSLRDAVLGVGANGTVDFDTQIAGSILNLQSPIPVSRSMTIDGSNLDPALAIDGRGTTRLFEIGAATSVEFDTFLFQNGWADTNEAGGALHSEAASLTIRNSTLTGNTAHHGGAVYQDGGAALLINSTLTGNQAVNGGAIAMDDAADLYLWSSTVAANTASSSSGAIYAFQDLPASSLGLRNSIVAANIAANDPEFGFHLAHEAPEGSNLIGDIENAPGVYPTDGILVGGGGFPVVDPRLGPLTDNGGPTPTMRPLKGSRAIDTGQPDPEVSADQRGVSRPLDGNYNGSIIPDIGAVERQADTLARLFPSTEPGGNGDANQNGISDYLEYAAGFDPTAPGTPPITPTFDLASRTFSHTVRSEADDVFSDYQYSSSLLPGSWRSIPLPNYQQSPGYTSEAPLIEIDGEDFLDLFDRIFLRVRFTPTPP